MAALAVSVRALGTYLEGGASGPGGTRREIAREQ
jgi:hypothetical protein